LRIAANSRRSGARHARIHPRRRRRIDMQHAGQNLDGIRAAERSGAR
jgi:hypothetical protein